MSKEITSCSPLDIAALVRTQDAGAMDRIVQCYMGYLLAVGRCACRDAEGAPDAVQDALLHATERLAQFRGDGSVKAWLSRMVVNACLCQARGRKNSPDWNQPLESVDLEIGNQSVPHEVSRREFQEQITSALDTLSESDRELFLLSQLHETTAPELAALFKKSPDAIRAQLTRIRRKLRSELAETWDQWRSSD